MTLLHVNSCRGAKKNQKRQQRFWGACGQMSKPVNQLELEPDEDPNEDQGNDDGLGGGTDRSDASVMQSWSS